MTLGTECVPVVVVVEGVWSCGCASMVLLVFVVVVATLLAMVSEVAGIS